METYVWIKNEELRFGKLGQMSIRTNRSTNSHGKNATDSQSKDATDLRAKSAR